MNRIGLPLLCLLLAACDSQNEPAGRADLQATVNGEALSFDVSVAVLTADGDASWGGLHCVPDRPPRNLTLALFVAAPERGSYPVGAGRAELYVGENDGDGGVGNYYPAMEHGASIAVDSYDARTGRFRGRFSGVFAVEAGTGPEYRLFPDTLALTEGAFDLTLVPIEDSEPGSEYPCP